MQQNIIDSKKGWNSVVAFVNKMLYPMLQGGLIMAKTASLNIRLDSQIKKNAETVYAYYGLSLTEAVTIFIHQSCNIGGLPFDLRPANPNFKSLMAITEAEKLNSDSYQSVKLPRSTGLGLWKDKVWMSDDFNESLDEMKEYME